MYTKNPLVSESYPQYISYHHHNLKSKQAFLTFVIPELSELVPDSYSLALITKIFAVGKNSRLYDLLFVKEKLVDHIKVNSICGQGNGLCEILIIPKKKRRPRSYSSINPRRI